MTCTCNKYIIVATDYCTKCVEVNALHDNTTMSMTKFVYEYLCCQFCYPIELVSDQGSHFSIDLFEISRHTTWWFIRKARHTIRKQMAWPSQQIRLYITFSKNSWMNIELIGMISYTVHSGRITWHSKQVSNLTISSGFPFGSSRAYRIPSTKSMSKNYQMTSWVWVRAGMT